MIEEEKVTGGPYPSIDLAFDWVKGILNHQEQLAGKYDDKLSMLLSVGSAILGIGLPFGLKITGGAFSPGSSSFIFILIAMGAYLAIAVLAIIGFRMRAIILLDDPKTIREDYWALLPWEFKEEILRYIEVYCESNAATLERRIRPAQIILGILPVETFALVIAFLLTV